MKRLWNRIRKAFAIHFVRRSAFKDPFGRDIIFKDCNYHTGFYRFSKYIDGNKPNFKIGGIPCMPQHGFETFVFYTETNLISEHGVIPVEQHYA